MPLYSRETVSGVVREREIFHIAPNTQNLKGANPRPPPEMTPEERQKYNNAQALRRFIRIVNQNFTPQDYYVTLTFSDQHLPETFVDARPILNNYFRRMLYAAPGMVAVAVMGRGIKTGRIHFHLLLSGVDRDTIKNRWKCGEVSRIEPLRPHNIYNGKDHGADYTGLATYLFKHWTTEQGHGKRWKQTKSIRPPDRDKRPKRVKRRYSEDKPPRPKPGYMLVEVKITNYGYMCFKYVRMPCDQNLPPSGGVCAL